MWRRGTNPDNDSGTRNRNKVTFVVCGGVGGTNPDNDSGTRKRSNLCGMWRRGSIHITLK